MTSLLERLSTLLPGAIEVWRVTFGSILADEGATVEDLGDGVSACRTSAGHLVFFSFGPDEWRELVLRALAAGINDGDFTEEEVDGRIALAPSFFREDLEFIIREEYPWMAIADRDIFGTTSRDGPRWPAWTVLDEQERAQAREAGRLE